MNGVDECMTSPFVFCLTDSADVAQMDGVKDFDVAKCYSTAADLSVALAAAQAAGHAETTRRLEDYLKEC